MTELFPPDYIGGAEISVSDLATHVGKKHEVVVFTPSYGRPTGLEEAGSFRIFRYPNLFRPLGSIVQQKLLFFAEMTKHLAIFAGDFRPEIVHAQNALSFPSVEKVGKTYRALSVAHVRDHRFECFTSRLACPSHNDATAAEFARCVGSRIYALSFPYAKIVTRTIRRALTRCDGAIAVSNYLKTELFHNANVDAKAIYDGVDLEKLQAISPNDELCGDSFEQNDTIFYGGGLDRFKGILELLGGFKQVLAKKENATLLIAGDGPLRQTVKELIDIGRMKENVILLGTLPNEKAISAMKIACLAVVPSLLPETGSRVAMEAMACGKPVIASCKGAIPEVIGDAGITVLPTADNIAGAILNLMQDESKLEELSVLARKRSVMFSVTTTCKEILESYEEWLNDL